MSLLIDPEDFHGLRSLTDEIDEYAFLFDIKIDKNGENRLTLVKQNNRPLIVRGTPSNVFIPPRFGAVGGHSHPKQLVQEFQHASDEYHPPSADDYAECATSYFVRRNPFQILVEKNYVWIYYPNIAFARSYCGDLYKIQKAGPNISAEDSDERAKLLINYYKVQKVIRNNSNIEGLKLMGAYKNKRPTTLEEYVREIGTCVDGEKSGFVVAAIAYRDLRKDSFAGIVNQIRNLCFDIF